MTSPIPTDKHPRVQSAFPWLVIGSILFVFSNGRWIIPIASWLAPVFLLGFMRSQEPLKGLAILFIVMCVAMRIMLYEIIPSTLGLMMYVLTLYYVLLCLIPYFVDRLFASRMNGFLSTLVFPLAGVVVEYLNTISFGSWCAVAYTQAGNLPLLQIMAVTGMWGVSFIVLWFGSFVNWIWENEFTWQKIARGAVVYVGTLTAVLFYGGVRIALHPPLAQNVRIASFTPSDELEEFYQGIKLKGYEATVEMAARDRKGLHELLNVLSPKVLERTRLEMRSGAPLVLWPEATVRVLQEDENEFLAKASEIAKTEHAWVVLAYLVLPLDHPDRLMENTSVLIDSSGTIRWRYLKTHPVPGSPEKPGEGVVPVVETPHGRLASVICYDMDFTNLVHQAGKAEADIMLVPASDWKAIDPLHSVMATFRAIENGFSMVRQTEGGLSIAVDFYGRVLGSMDHYTTKDQHMTAQVPTKGIRTVYSSIGDSFAWACLAFLLFLIVRSLIRKVHPA